MNKFSASKKEQSKDLQLEDGSTLKWFDKNYKFFLNKTTLIYGRTQSGKSTIIDEIMYLCKEHISSIFVICQSSSSSSSPYKGKVPSNCIKTKVTKEWLENLMVIQQGRAELYKTANNLDNLKKVCDRLNNTEVKRNETIINNETDKSIERVKNNNRIDFAMKKSQITHINNIRCENLINIYKNAIRKFRVELESIPNLSPNEYCCVEFVDFNPNLMLAYTDCAASFKKWVKNSEKIKEMFYNGRHHFITQIIDAQDDKEIDSELRKNALVSIFTTDQAATANFDRASNAYSKYIKERSRHCIKKVFAPDQYLDVKNWKKLVYIQQNDVPEPFAYTIADIYDDFRMGGEPLWQIDNKLSEKKDSSQSNTDFFKKYINTGF